MEIQNSSPKNQDPSKWVTYLSYGCVCIVLLVTVGFLGMTYLLSPKGSISFKRVEFSPVEWTKAGKIEYCNPRWHMKDEIIASKVLLGISKNQLLKKLGRPDEIEFHVSLDSKEKLEELQWYLGYCSGIGIDMDILFVEIKKDSVINVSWRQT